MFVGSKTRTFKKGEIIVDHFEIFRNLFLVEKGFVRIFYIDNKGNEITRWFADEGSIVAVLSSFIYQIPSPFALQALEDTVVRHMSFDQFEEIRQSDQKIQDRFVVAIINVAVGLSDSLMDLHIKSARERYEKLIEDHPDIFLRAKLGHIATYLGITQQSLSRIRAER